MSASYELRNAAREVMRAPDYIQRQSIANVMKAAADKMDKMERELVELRERK